MSLLKYENNVARGQRKMEQQPSP